jgi:DNA-binding CsgD family transcriptional regulator
VITPEQHHGVLVRLGPAHRVFEGALVAALRDRGFLADAAGDRFEVPLHRATVLAEGLLDRGPGRPGVSPGTILLVARDDRAAHRAARSAGAVGCLPLRASLDQLAQAVSLVLAGDVSVLEPSAPDSDVAPLTSREIDVLQLMAAGHDNAAIAEHLEISPHTARTHVQRILAKFEVRSRFSAVSVARGQGLLRTGS